jgi:hypothetical protein
MGSGFSLTSGNNWFFKLGDDVEPITYMPPEETDGNLSKTTESNTGDAFIVKGGSGTNTSDDSDFYYLPTK